MGGNGEKKTGQARLDNLSEEASAAPLAIRGHSFC